MPHVRRTRLDYAEDGTPLLRAKHVLVPRELVLVAPQPEPVFEPVVPVPEPVPAVAPKPKTTRCLTVSVPPDLYDLITERAWQTRNRSVAGYLRQLLLEDLRDAYDDDGPPTPETEVHEGVA